MEIQDSKTGSRRMHVSLLACGMYFAPLKNAACLCLILQTDACGKSIVAQPHVNTNHLQTDTVVSTFHILFIKL